jgi:hypothetical protein
MRLSLRSVSPRFVALAAMAVAFAPVVAAAGPGGPALPTTLIGEAVSVALAFSAPALLAGAYLAARSIGRRIGLRGALVIGVGSIAAGFLVAAVNQRPDLINIAMLTRLAGL